MTIWEKISIFFRGICAKISFSTRPLLRKIVFYSLIFVLVIGALASGGLILLNRKAKTAEAAVDLCRRDSWPAGAIVGGTDYISGTEYYQSMTILGNGRLIFDTSNAHLVIGDNLTVDAPTVDKGGAIWAGASYYQNDNPGKAVRITVCNGDLQLNGEIRADEANREADTGKDGLNGTRAEVYFSARDDLWGGGGAGGNGGAGGGGGAAVAITAPAGIIDAAGFGGGAGAALFGDKGETGKGFYFDGTGGEPLTPTTEIDANARAYALAIAAAKRGEDPLSFLSDTKHLVGGRGAATKENNVPKKFAAGGGFISIIVQNGELRFGGGEINAKGADAVQVTVDSDNKLAGGCGDGWQEGGGGAGGTVYIKANTVFDPTINVSGGRGANGIVTWGGCFLAAGGGGGGGIIYLDGSKAGATLIMNINGGDRGTGAVSGDDIARAGSKGAKGVVVEPLEILGISAGIQITKETFSDAGRTKKTSTFNSGEDVYVTLEIKAPSSLSDNTVEEELPTGVTKINVSSGCGGVITGDKTVTGNKYSWTLNESNISCTIKYKFTMP